MSKRKSVKITMLPVGHFDSAEQGRVNLLQLAARAECTVCDKRFTKGTRRLTAGQVGLTHECGTGHLVRPVRQKGD